ncbi:recombinase family protein [Peribacillus acanthi]|uniref:recombinase family protein n=1 Tax=Peribacillus acanthi TaxID=2171554 RepID=UPI000D3EAE89|nr:recombinase family protein [Peribacillus acanthi]
MHTSLLKSDDFMFSESTKRRVAIYARVSTVEQADEGYSIDEQVRILREWCDRYGYEVYKEYVDRGISGKNIDGRPALKQLISDSNNKKFDIVIVWKINRLSRDILDTLRVVKNFKQNGITFKSYSENFETETHQGEMFFQMMAVLAEFERKQISENVKLGMIARAREGSWNGGQVLGYDTVEISNENKKRKSTKLVINEKEAQTVRRIFQLYLDGNGYKSIANTVNHEGHRSKKNNHFSINAIRTILTNPIYAGYIRYNVRRDWSEKRRNNINPSPVIERGNHTPILSEDTWNKAKAILEKRTGKPNRVHSGEYPLTGLLKCPVCGAGMVLGRTTNKNKDGTKKVLEYYVCGTWKNKGTAACNSNSIRVDYADKYVLDKISHFANTDELIKDVVDRINNGDKDQMAPVQKEYQIIIKSLEGINSKKDKVLELFEDGVLSKSELVDRLAKINDEKQVLEDRLKPLEKQLNQSNQVEISVKVVKEVMTNFEKVYKDTITTEQKKHLLQLLISSITIKDRKKIDTIQIQLNNNLVDRFTLKGEEKSSDDDFSSPFLIIFSI